MEAIKCMGAIGLDQKHLQVQAYILCSIILFPEVSNIADCSDNLAARLQNS